MTSKQPIVDGLPTGWSASTLKTAADIAAGINKPLSEMGQGALYVTVQDLYSGTSIKTAQLGRIRVSDAELLAAALKPGDIVFGKSSVKRDGIGYPSQFLGSDEPVVFSGFTYRARAREGVADPTFLFHALRSGPTRRWLIDNSQASALTNINQRIADAIPVTIPPLTEQRAIAETLGDVDALLTGLDRLIAKKRDLKQAAMQELLTGQTRLPGFQGEWVVKSLGELCSLKSGQAITSANIDDHSPYRCFGGNGLRGFTRTFTHEGAYALIGRQGALCGNVVGVEGKFFASEHALVVTARPAASIAWLTFVLGRMNLNQYSESSAQPGLSAAKLLGLGVHTPPSVAEQTAIAGVLSDMDAEITALEARRDKTCALKQGTMQELLTGRTRLV